MILKNYVALLCNFLSLPTNGSGQIPAAQMTYLNGTRQPYYGIQNYVRLSQNFANYAYPKARLGSGTDDVSFYDYCLSNDITSNLSNVKLVNTINMGDNGIERTFTITGNNNTNSDMTITEVGITISVIYGTSPSSTNNADLMIFKHKLDESVTIHSGQGFNIVLQTTENIVEI